MQYYRHKNVHDGSRLSHCESYAALTDACPSLILRIDVSSIMAK